MIVDNAVYRDGARLDCGLPTKDLAGVRSQATEASDFVWVGLHDPTEDELDAVARLYDLHPLAVEDALRAHQRPKLERYDESLFLVLKTLWYVDEDDQVETGEINIFLGEKFVVTVRHGIGSGLHEARISLEGMEQLLAKGPAAVVYAVCDAVVDRYEAVVGSLVEDVDEVEASVFSEVRIKDANRIYVLKRELAEMRRAVLPLRDPINRFVLGGVRGVDPDSGPYFRDIADHLTRVAETIDSLDGLLSSAFDAYLAQISIKQNDDMRKISAWVGIAAVPTVFTGFYGMNFNNLPVLHNGSGWLIVIAVMATICGGIFVTFKRAGWL